MAEAATICPACGAKSRTEYQLLGSAVFCTGCLSDTVPKIPDGGTIPFHEWDVTFQDFKQLIGYPAYRASIEPLFSEWFGYKLSGEGSATLILNDQGEAIDPLWLHMKVQSTPAQQYALYQRAMSLWR